MAGIPAICNNCGITFEVSNLIGPGVIANFIGCSTGPCPGCGGIGRIVDGRYQFVGEAVRLLGAAQDAAQLRHVQSILTEARQQGAAPQAVAEQIEAETPELSAFANWIRQYLLPKSAADVYGLIGIILTAIGLLVTLMQQQPQTPQKGLTDKDVEKIVEKAVSAALAQTQAAQPSGKVAKPAAMPKKVAKRKIGRNDPCPCHSGKKYKMCCLK